MEDQAVGHQVVVFDGLPLLVAAVLSDDAFAAEEGPLKEAVECLALVRGTLDGRPQLRVRDVAKQEAGADDSSDQQTLPLQIKTMREYALRRGWQITTEIKEVGLGALQRPKREELLAAARRRELDAILVWRLDRWGRSLPDLVVTLKELAELSIGFVSLTEAFDMTTPTGRALAGMLAVFAEFEHEILRERVKAGIAQARAKGTTFGRPKSAAKKTAEIKRLYRKEKLSKSEIARRLGIGRTSVRRLLENS